MRFLVLSDLHLGAHPGVHHDGVAEQAVAILEKARLNKTADVVVLNGDVFDNWAHPIDAKPPSWTVIMCQPDVEPFTGELLNWGKENVWYVRGNHDFDVGNLFNVTMFTEGTAYKQLWFEHGHRMDFFNAPDPAGRKYPFGYFITRVHTQGIKNKAPALNQNIHSYLDESLLADGLAAKFRHVTLPQLVMAAVALDAGVPMTARVPMPDGTNPTLLDVVDQYSSLTLDWANKVGIPDATQMLLVSAEQMQWEAQEILKGAHKQILTMGHSHKPEYHYYDGIGGYVNDGAMCIGTPTWTRIDYPDSGKDAVRIEQYRWNMGFDVPVSTTWVSQ